MSKVVYQIDGSDWRYHVMALEGLGGKPAWAVADRTDYLSDAKEAARRFAEKNRCPVQVVDLWIEE